MNKDYAIKTVYEFYYNDLEFCGCGNPENIIKVARNIMRIIKNKFDNDIDWKESDRELYKALGFPEESHDNEVVNAVVDFIFNVLDNANILDHGSSIGGAWLSTTGETTLTALEMLSDDEIDDLDNVYETAKEAAIGGNKNE